MGNETLEESWIEEAEKVVKDRKITAVSLMTREQADARGWVQRPLQLILDNGTVLFGQADPEGNDAGALGGQTPDGEWLCLPPL